jgi:hypothetical protein
MNEHLHQKAIEAILKRYPNEDKGTMFLTYEFDRGMWHLKILSETVASARSLENLLDELQVAKET